MKQRIEWREFPDRLVVEEDSRMEAKELRDMSMDDLTQKRTELREEIGHLKLKRATSRLENPMKLRQTKRDLARVETILREKALDSGKGLV